MGEELHQHHRSPLKVQDGLLVLFAHLGGFLKQLKSLPLVQQQHEERIKVPNARPRMVL